MSTRSKAEGWLSLQLEAMTEFPFEQQYRFHPVRRWRSDFAIWPTREKEGLPLLVEVEGVTYRQQRLGRHQRPQGYENDCEKYAEAMCMGHMVLRVTPKQVTQGVAIEWVKRILDRRLTDE